MIGKPSLKQLAARASDIAHPNPNPKRHKATEPLIFNFSPNSGSHIALRQKSVRGDNEESMKGQFNPMKLMDLLGAPD